jgi:hypothetical protein
MKLKKKSSPLKLLSQSQPNFAEMILGWPLSKKQFWPFEEISIFSNSGHLEWRAGLSDTILKGTHPGTIPARFGLIKLKIEKRGDEILIVHCCFSVSQNELKF